MEELYAPTADDADGVDNVDEEEQGLRSHRDILLDLQLLEFASEGLGMKKEIVRSKQTSISSDEEVNPLFLYCLTLINTTPGCSSGLLNIYVYIYRQKATSVVCCWTRPALL
jgi:hypothetical protein